jgi:hypothetical protein
MHVIGDPADGQHFDFKVFRYSKQVCMEQLLLLLGYEVNAVLGAENAMHEIAGIRMRHSVVPCGTRLRLDGPALALWANECCPLGRKPPYSRQFVPEIQ